MKSNWNFICDLEEVFPDSGVAALVEGKQLAIFRVGSDQIYALDNFDPNSEANVMSRGLVGDINGEPVVASPVYKHHFSLITGRCIEDPEQSILAYPARISEGRVWVRSMPIRAAQRTRRLVVIGNGMAGMKVVEDLLQIAPAAYEVTVFGAEPHPNYNRILLSPVLAGEKTVKDIVLNPFEWYQEKGVKLHVNDPVVAIDRRRKTVTAKSGTVVSYDRLLLATGSNPIVLPIPGKDLAGVVTFRDLQDVDSMLQAARTHKKAVVIGGGLLGLEAANGLMKQGMDVTVVHLLDTLMERQLDRAAATMLRESLEKRGLKFVMPAKTVAILGSASALAADHIPVGRGLQTTDSGDHVRGDRVRAVRFEDGREIEADLVVMAAGIRPNIDLAKAVGLRCDRGVLVNDTMQTFDPSIYAVGECVQHRNSTYGLIAPLFEQANVCATHLAEFGIGRYQGSLISTQLKVTGIDLFSAGDFLGGPTSEALVLRDAKRGIYKRIVIEKNRVRGAVLYGDVKDGPWYFELMTQGKDIGPMRDKLLFGSAFVK
jgi:NAD(P)H-dependent nitrite reductase small subunit